MSAERSTLPPIAALKDDREFYRRFIFMDHEFYDAVVQIGEEIAEEMTAKKQRVPPSYRKGVAT